MPAVVIGVAAAAAALVIIGYWIQNAVSFSQKVSAMQQQEAALIASGMSPAQAAATAANAVSNLSPSSGSGNNLLGIPWNLLITGAVLVFLGPPIVEAFTKGGSK